MFAVLQYPQYRRLWSAQLVSQLGDWLGRMAVLSIVDGANLGLWFALELALRLLPTALLGPIAGPIADRMPRRMLMVLADVARALTVFGMVFAFSAGNQALVFVLIGVQMAMSTIFEAARAGAVPSTVPKEELHAAYTLSAATWSSTLALGTGLSFVLLEMFGPEMLFWIDGGTYLLSAICLVGLHLPPVPKHPEAFSWRDVLMLQELRRAWDHLGEHSARAAISAKWYWGGAGGFLVAIPLLARERFHGGGDELNPASAISLLYMARGIGTGVGPWIARHLGTSDAALWRATAVAFCVASVGYGCVAGATTLWVAFVLILVAHMGGSTIWVSATTIWQRRIDDRFRGRVHSLEFTGMTLAFTASGLVVGLAYDAGVRLSTLLVGLAVFVFVAGQVWTRRSREALASSLAPGIETPNVT